MMNRLLDNICFMLDHCDASDKRTSRKLCASEGLFKGRITLREFWAIADSMGFAALFPVDLLNKELTLGAPLPLSAG
ncbi:hypothetical protein HMPREF2999_04655 [Rothia sp. HMSC066H02]|nr:hypothetical protein HMPREF3008_06270 [Rothia sp. HMSC065D09]OFP14269.1 hypothetical protein HMPREF2999_04655 [Rothia sp. HMSC066H02]